MTPLQQPVAGLLVALAVGLMAGVQREQAADGELQEAAGVRTFAVCAALGNLAWLLGVAVFVGALLAVAALNVAAYVRTSRTDAGLTSEAALLAVTVLGALAATRPALAAAAGVGLTLLLAVKDDIHRFARTVVGRQDLLDGLLLAAAALVVMPLLPDRTLDPWGAFNPHLLWGLVVLVMAIQAAGYIALRALGPRLGLLFAGFSGGFVSSTATIGSLAAMARERPSLRAACRAGAMLSNLSTVVQLGLIVAVLAPSLLGRMLPALAAMAVLAVPSALWMGRGERGGEAAMPARHLFRFRHALVFAATVAVALLAAAAIRAGGRADSVTWVALATGFADVHAATIAVLETLGDAAPSLPLRLVALAFASNSATKCVAAVVGGGWRFAMPLMVGIAALNAVFLTVAFAFG